MLKCKAKLISDVFGVSGRKLLERLIEQGYVDPSVRNTDSRKNGCVKR
jgi:hypothetical protein